MSSAYARARDGPKKRRFFQGIKGLDCLAGGLRKLYAYGFKIV